MRVCQRAAQVGEETALVKVISRDFSPRTHREQLPVRTGVSQLTRYCLIEQISYFSLSCSSLNTSTRAHTQSAGYYRRVTAACDYSTDSCRVFIHYRESKQNSPTGFTAKSSCEVKVDYKSVLLQHRREFHQICSHKNNKTEI